MRIFIALDIGDAIRERIRLFVNGVEGFAPEVRFVRPESLHITLKFIGEKPTDAVDRIKHALSSVQPFAHFFPHRADEEYSENNDRAYR